MRRTISYQEDSSSAYCPHPSYTAGDLVASDWFDPNKDHPVDLGHLEPPPDPCSGQPDLESELKFLQPEEREHIQEVMRRDTIVRLYNQLKVR